MTNYPNISVAHNSRFTSCSHFICLWLFSEGPFMGLGPALVWIMVSLWQKRCLFKLQLTAQVPWAKAGHLPQPTRGGDRRSFALSFFL